MTSKSVGITRWVSRPVLHLRYVFWLQHLNANPTAIRGHENPDSDLARKKNLGIFSQGAQKKLTFGCLKIYLTGKCSLSQIILKKTTIRIAKVSPQWICFVFFRTLFWHLDMATPSVENKHPLHHFEARNGSKKLLLLP